jgi:hypothetical protein
LVGIYILFIFAQSKKVNGFATYAKTNRGGKKKPAFAHQSDDWIGSVDPASGVAVHHALF